MSTDIKRMGAGNTSRTNESRFLSVLPIGRWRSCGLFLFLVWKGFTDNRCASRAAALAYTTLLALVPMMAVMLSVSKNFLHEQSADLVPKAIDRIVTMVAPELQYMPEPGKEQTATPAKPGQVKVSDKARQEAVAKIQSFIDNIDAGALGTVGTILLIVVAIRLMMTIEDAFNDVWGVTRGRTIWQKIVYYWATITLGPLLLVLALVMTGQTEVSRLMGKLSAVPGLERAILFLMPFFVLWLAFGLMYALMPNTRVQVKAAAVGGIVAGTLWQLNNLLSTLYVSRVVSASKVYGSLGILPVLLAGLYFSWVIVLIGVQISCVMQCFRSEMERHAREELDQEGRELAGCKLVFAACEHFLRGLRPVCADESARVLGIALPDMRHIADRLVRSGILAEVANDSASFLPARVPELITVADVLHALRAEPGKKSESMREQQNDPAIRAVRELYALENKSPANVTFADLAKVSRS